MHDEDHDGALCPGCLQARDLIAQIEAAMDRSGEPDPFDVIATLPLMLESALANMLAEFDYEAQRESRLGVAVRLLMLAAARAEVVRVRAEGMRRWIAAENNAAMPGENAPLH